MPPLGMPPLIILALFCEAFVCIRSSVEVQVSLSFSCFRLPIHTMPLLRNADWQEPCTSIRSTPGLFAWMPPLGACASSAGFIRCWVPVRLFPGIPKTRRTVLACPQRGPEKNSASASLIERFFGRVFLFFHLQRPPLCGWSEIASQVALTYAASVIVGLAARACWSSRSHPFSQTCPSSSVGGGVRGVKRPRLE